MKVGIVPTLDKLSLIFLRDSSANGSNTPARSKISGPAATRGDAFTHLLN